MVSKGFRFGMLLQIAVGPVCLFIFQTAVKQGIFAAWMGVAGVVLVDAAYIFLAIGGVGALMRNNPSVTTVIRYAGALILVAFGLSNALGAFGLSLLPAFHGQMHQGGAFVGAIVLTLTNPLSVLFWAGVFSTRLTQDGMDKNHAATFGLGAVLATLFFLSLVAVLGSVVSTFLTELMVSILNAAVGVALIAFGIHTAWKTKKDV